VRAYHPSSAKNVEKRVNGAGPKQAGCYQVESAFSRGHFSSGYNKHRQFVSRMNWSETSLLSWDMLMQKYINAKMIAALDQ